MTPSEQAAAHDRNWIATFGAMADALPRGFRLDTPTVTVVASGTAIMNKVIVTDPRPNPDDLDRALALVRSHRVPYEVFVRATDDAAIRMAEGAGLARAWEMPCMVRPLPIAPPSPRRDRAFAVRRVDAALMPAFRDVAGQAFEMPAHLAREVFETSLLALSGLRAFIGFEDGRPVACAASFLTGTTVGIYTVGTLEAVRGRGYGSAVTIAAMTDTAAPASIAILQASQMGRPVYERLSFRTTHVMAVFTDPADAAT